mgnify:CR=1 FL=1
MSKLIRPISSEKSSALMAGGVYAFRVERDANKLEIKKTVEDTYKVNVLRVNLINVPPKKRIFRGRPGFKKGYRKAMVFLKKGESIDLT